MSLDGLNNLLRSGLNANTANEQPQQTPNPIANLQNAGGEGASSDSPYRTDANSAIHQAPALASTNNTEQAPTAETAQAQAANNGSSSLEAYVGEALSKLNSELIVSLKQAAENNQPPTTTASSPDSFQTVHSRATVSTPEIEAATEALGKARDEIRSNLGFAIKDEQLVGVLKLGSKGLRESLSKDATMLDKSIAVAIAVAEAGEEFAKANSDVDAEKNQAAFISQLKTGGDDVKASILDRAAELILEDAAQRHNTLEAHQALTEYLKAQSVAEEASSDSSNDIFSFIRQLFGMTTELSPAEKARMEVISKLTEMKEAFFKANETRISDFQAALSEKFRAQHGAEARKLLEDLHAKEVDKAMEAYFKF